jgi:hypothetical protein
MFPYWRSMGDQEHEAISDHLLDRLSSGIEL